MGPPTGTVTLLFTDLERSTVSWEHHPDSMASALERHDTLLRTVIEDHDGHVFSTAGDSFGAAFASARDAARAAMTAQRALRSEAWPDPVLLASRMGLHSGTAYERGENYFGPAVNRAARIMATGSGGQVLVSAATAALLADEDVELRDLGVHRLRDLLAPEHLFQLVVDDDVAVYPSLRTLEDLNHKLPIVRSTLHGRGADVEAVRVALSRSGLLTLTGTGGVGKTRLALEVAVRSLDEFGRTVFVDLAPVSDRDMLLRAVAGALGLLVLEDVQGIVHELQRNKSLVILDNCEQIVDAVGELVEEIGRHAPHCVILATSREPLGVVGEHIWRVPSLSDEAAVDLLMERASAVRPELEPDDVSRRAALDIARRLDGVPLALELAAGRASHLSLSEISSRLDQRFELLTGGRRRVIGRQQTLAATMDWSYGLLKSEERSLLRASSVFVGGFTLDAISEVAELGRSVALDIVGSLVEKSLVVPDESGDGKTRYLLLETVRLYAREQLVAEDEAINRRERHARWFRGRSHSSRDAFSGDWMVWTDQVEPEWFIDRDNVVSALEWCNTRGDLVGVAELAWAVSPLMSLYEWSDPGWDYLGREEVIAALEPLGRAYYLFASALNANSLGDYTMQRSFCERGLRHVDSGPLGAGLKASLSVAVMVTDPDRADQIADEVVRMAPSQSPIASEARRLKAGAAMMRGDIDSATARLATIQADPFTASEYALGLHLLGEHDRMRDVLGQRADSSGRDWFAYRWPMLEALDRAVAGDPQGALERAKDAHELVVRLPGILLDRDLLFTLGAVILLDGDPFRCARLLAVEEATIRARSPGSWQLYLHYRRLARSQLSRSDVEDAREQATGQSVKGALAEELGPVGHAD